MVEAELIVANLPAMHEQKEAIGTWWNTSHHSQNFRDAKEAARETFMSSSLLTKALTVPFGIGLVGAEAYELSWKNENKIAEIATERFVASGGQDIIDPARGVAAFTGKLELAIGIGAVIALHKYRPAMDVIRKRYFAEHDTGSVTEADLPEDSGVVKADNPGRFKGMVLRPIARAGKIWGLSFATGALGATTLEDASRSEYSRTKNVATAIATAGMLAVNNATIAGGVLWGIKTNTPYVSDGLMNLAELFKTPVFVASLLGGGMTKRAISERRRIKQKWAQEESQTDRSSQEVTDTLNASL